MKTTYVNKEQLLNILRMRKYEYLMSSIEGESMSYDDVVDTINYVNDIDDEITYVESLKIGDKITTSKYIYEDLDYLKEYDPDGTYYINDENTIKIDFETLKKLLTVDVLTLN